MKVHISFERPSGFVLELDGLQQAAFEKWTKAREHADSFDWGDESCESWAALTASNGAWDEFIDSISYELGNATTAEVFQDAHGLVEVGEAEAYDVIETRRRRK